MIAWSILGAFWGKNDRMYDNFAENYTERDRKSWSARALMPGSFGGFPFQRRISNTKQVTKYPDVINPSR